MSISPWFSKYKILWTNDKFYGRRETTKFGIKKGFLEHYIFLLCTYMIGNIYFIHENSHEYVRHMACMLQKYQIFLSIVNDYPVHLALIQNRPLVARRFWV
jgi:hypothetical protein